MLKLAKENALPAKDNVIEGNFGQKKEIVYQCLNCEGQTFWLDEQGTITCKACKATQLPPKEWVDILTSQYE